MVVKNESVNGKMGNPSWKKPDGRENNPGRPKIPESEKKPPYQPTGNPRGRPFGSGKEKKPCQPALNPRVTRSKKTT